MPDHSRPNILFLLADQHRGDWMSSNAALSLHTPHLDALAARGTSFSQAYCGSPLCAPSRAMLASGRAYGECGVPNNNFDYPLDQPTYYRSLRDAGYRVAGVGKFDLHKDTSDTTKLDWGLDGSRLLAEWGFTEGIDNEGKCDGSASFRVSGGPRGPYLKYLQERGLVSAYLDEHAAEARRACLDAYTTILPDDAYCDNWLTANGLHMIDGFPEEQPWHLVVNFTGPHNPFDVTESMQARWSDREVPPPIANSTHDPEQLLRCRRNYAAMIENIDSCCGDLIAAVAERGELDRTVIVYAADHGEMMGDHGRFGKCTWHQPSVHVPMIAAGPGIMTAVESSALVLLHDWTATFLEYAAAAPLPGMTARPLQPVLSGTQSAHREAAVSELGNWRMITDGRHKLVTQADAPPALFDLADTPLELRDLARSQPERAAALQQMLADWRG
jgi:arylsulfatase A-like enzyme